jgi:hypothetical protein
MLSFKNPKSIMVQKPKLIQSPDQIRRGALAQTVGAVALLNQGKMWSSSFLILVLLVLLAFGFDELYCILEPLHSVWSMLLAKLSDISLALSEQASELRRLKSLLSEFQTTKLGSVSAVADAAEGQASSWALLSEVQSLFAYIMFVYERVWRTLGLVLVTSATVSLG